MHLLVLIVLAVVAASLSALVWFSSTIGYAQPGSIIAGADLRGSIILILWSLVAVLALTSTAVIAIAGMLSERRLVPLAAAYVIGLGVLPLAMIVIDKYV